MTWILLLLCAAGWAWASPIYNVTDLGSLGGPAAQAFGLNAGGLAVGSATNNFGYTHAFSSLGNGMTDLTIDTGASEGIASGVNASGEIAGTQYFNGQPQATVWINGTPQAIDGAFATSINDSGEVAGMLANGHAFAGANELTAFDWSAAYGINSSGQVAGYAQTAPGVFRGFVWTPSTGYIVLGTLGGTNSYAMAINDAGQVAGNAQMGTGYLHAFLATGGVMQDLGSLGGSSFAYGVNSDGDVAGYSYTDGGDPHAFVFEHGVMIDLNSLIDPASGWVLTEAYAINGSGQIAGSGLFHGVEHAFRLDYADGYLDVPQGLNDAATPEPATWMLAVAGLALILSSRIRFRPRLRQPRRAPTRELPQ